MLMIEEFISCGARIGWTDPRVNSAEQLSAGKEFRDSLAESAEGFRTQLEALLKARMCFATGLLATTLRIYKLRLLRICSINLI